MNNNSDKLSETAKLILENNKWSDNNNECNFTIQTLLESLSEGVAIVNSEGKIIFVNNRLCEMLEYNNCDLLYKDVSLLVPDAFKHNHSSHIEEYFDQPKVRRMGLGNDLTARKQNGDILPIEISLSYINLEEDKVSMAFITDISKRKKFESELKERNKALKAFSKMVAHDLNSSLSTIVGISNLLIDKEIEISDDKREYYLKEIAERSTKLSIVVNEMLLLARMHKKKVELEPINIEISLKEAIKRLTVLIERHYPEFTIKPLINSMGHSQWVEEIWLNYISNAINYGGDPCKIEIGCSVEDNFVKYWVKDNGQGLSAEEIDVILNSNEIENNDLIKGHGIGLMVVKNVLKNMGGFIDVKSELDQGSTFYFYLPPIKQTDTPITK